ncbi:MAG TPA: ribonuclease J [Stellaceae bacterium]|nr:ribonuclease J [Stellaceae bacterium]
MSHKPPPTLNRPDELVFVALGGMGEIGMNLGLFGYGGKWLMVDLGISFGDDTTPGLEILMPDPAFIEARRKDLVGLVVTHAHEDHIGAIPHLWPRLECPIYATPFAASVVRMKLTDAGVLEPKKLHVVPLSGKFSVGPFEIELISLTHSIPEPNALVVRTPAGTALHTGDWKFDPEPVIGTPSDFAALSRLGEAGVDALLCDSTNALRPGEAGSESAVRKALTELVAGYDTRVVATCFSSNVGRLESIALAAEAAGRSCALVGRSLWRMEQAARENGYLAGIPPFVREDEVMDLPRDQIVMICTGSQGEPRSALTRIATGDHPNVELEPGDVVIFSSRIIPGNERAVGRLHNQLAQLGVRLVTDEDHFVHVSGHPARDELTRMYQLVRPKAALPIHGESRHLMAHAALAEDCQVPVAIVAGNGDIVRLAPGPAGVIDHVDSGRLGLDGKNLVPLEGGAFRTRMRMTSGGAAVATVVLDRRGKLAARPQVTVHGLLGEASESAMEKIEDDVARALSEVPPGDRGDDDLMRETARLAVRRSLWASHGKKPVTEVHVVRIM